MPETIVPLKLDPAETNRTRIEREIAAQLYASAYTRREFIRDPRGTIREMTGIRIPKTIAIEVHEETPTKYHLVLPAKRESDCGDTLLDVFLNSRYAAYQTQALDGIQLQLGYDDLLRGNIEAVIINRALKDPGFRSDLIAYPKKVLGELLCVTFPESYEVHIHEESENLVHLVVGNNPDVPYEVRDQVPDGVLRTIAYDCPDACRTAAGTICGTCSLVTYCTEPPC